MRRLSMLVVGGNWDIFLQTNQTRVNDQLIDSDVRMALRPGDRIEVGGVELQFHHGRRFGSGDPACTVGAEPTLQLTYLTPPGHPGGKSPGRSFRPRRSRRRNQVGYCHLK